MTKWQRNKIDDEISTKEEQKSKTQQPQKISPLDPDFILMFFFAAFSDALDIFFDLITTLTQIPFPKLIGEGIDLITMLVLTAWIYHRTKQISVTKRGIKVGWSVAKRIIPAIIIEEGSGLGLGISSWIGVFPSWTIAVISTLF
jgi:hypothetical protein